MQGADIYAALKRIGATQLHHANSVLTSCTFLQRGGLLSRGYVEEHGLEQTPQSSDAIDKKYGIWNRIFVDHVNIHGRAGRPNYYGPVLFVFDFDILLHLPTDSDVMVTKKNPVHWLDTDKKSDRWFENTEELRRHLGYGDFDKMLVIRTPSNELKFPDRRAQVYLDDPKTKLSSGKNAYNHAKLRLQAAANEGHISVSITPHSCRAACTCVEKYAAYQAGAIDTYFA